MQASFSEAGKPGSDAWNPLALAKRRCQNQKEVTFLLVEFAQMRTTDHISVPCRTYNCNNMAEYSVGGSDAAQFTWHWLCASCAVAVVQSALGLPGIKGAIPNESLVSARSYECPHCAQVFPNALARYSHIKYKSCQKEA